MKRRDIHRLAWAGLMPAAWAQTSQAAPARFTPQRVVKIIVPYTPGGTNDVLARLIADELKSMWPHPVLVDNRPGASGTIGADAVAKAQPDGHTLLLTITALLQNATLIPKLPYNPYKDLAPLTQLSTSANLLVVSSKLSAKSAAEFVALVKREPRRHSYGSYGVGTSAHLLGAQLARQAGLDMAHAPYKGAMPMLTDLLGGHLSAAFLDLGTAREHLSSGGFRVLGVTGPERVALVPEVPTLAELGYTNMQWLGWFGMFTTGGTPPDVVEKISLDIRTALKSPALQARIEQAGQKFVGSSASDFAKVIQTDGPIYARMISELGITMN